MAEFNYSNYDPFPQKMSSVYHSNDTNCDGKLSEILENIPSIINMQTMELALEGSQQSNNSTTQKYIQSEELKARMAKMYEEITKIQLEIASQPYETTESGVKQADKKINKLMTLNNAYYDLQEQAAIIEKDLRDMSSNNANPTVNPSDNKT